MSEPTALSAVKIASRAVRHVAVVLRMYVSVSGLDFCKFVISCRTCIVDNNKSVATCVTTVVCEL